MEQTKALRQMAIEHLKMLEAKEAKENAVNNYSK